MGSVLIVACSDSTAPVTARVPGTYELTTVLESYTYSSSCIPTEMGLRCSDTTIAAGASKLYGTFTLGDAGREVSDSPHVACDLSR